MSARPPTVDAVTDAAEPEAKPESATNEDPADRPTLGERRATAQAALEAELAADPEAAEKTTAAASASLAKMYAAASGMDKFKPFTTRDIGLAKYVQGIDAFKNLGIFNQARALPVQKLGVANLLGGNLGSANLLKGVVTGVDPAIMKRATIVFDTSALTGIANAASIAAGLRIDSDLGKHLDAINSLGLRTFDIPRFDVPTFDFGLDRLAKSLRLLEPALRDLPERLRPRNLRELDISVLDLGDIMRDEGIPFCLVPDPDTVQMLYEADDANERRALLTQRAEPILDACDDIIGLCIEPDLAILGMYLRRAIAAYTHGHAEAAQALATNVLDTLVRKYTHHAQLTGSDGIDHVMRQTRQHWMFLAPIPVAHTKTWDLPANPFFNRHATAHMVSHTHYTDANAVQAVMLATSMLGYHQHLW